MYVVRLPAVTVRNSRIKSAESSTRLEHSMAHEHLRGSGASCSSPGRKESPPPICHGGLIFGIDEMWRHCAKIHVEFVWIPDPHRQKKNFFHGVAFMTIADVVIDRIIPGLDQLWSYEMPPDLSVAVGQRVRIPFGRTQSNGIVTRLREENDVDKKLALKPILGVVEPYPLLSPYMVELGLWMAQEYLCFPMQAYKAMLPRSIRLKPWVHFMAEEVCSVVAPRQNSRHSKSRKQQLWELLQNRGPMLKRELLAERPEMRSALRDLVKEGSVALSYRDKSQSPHLIKSHPSPYTLNEEQADAVNKIWAGSIGSKWLLEGITGSGKTEVYLQLIDKTIQQGKQVLVLVPEIALTPQTVLRFQTRFGDRVGLWHSSLTDRDRALTWQAARQGELTIVVGVRSAIFLPFEQLGLIVLDEEHEGTYKQEEHPRYHTRDVAFWLADHIGAKVILGSATPALETAFFARQNVIGWIRLTRRIGQRTLPPVEIVDMRQELQDGNHSIFSRALQHELTQVLSRSEQAILFLNRRGYASFVMCRDCGQAVQCPNCAVTLTYHQNQNQLVCHYCFFSMDPPKLCTHCGSRRIRYFGAGTERVAEEVHKLWPAARVLRADRDTLNSRQSYFQLYQDFMAQRADVLVGTQMIAKGMDFSQVSVVGIVAADVALHLPDFRRSERTFQLLVQASGRTGRGEIPGKVVVQAYEPEHFAIQSAKTHSYDGFYRQEIEYRKELGYPPYGNLWLLEVAETSDDRAQRTISRIADKVHVLASMGLQILGPAPAPLPKVRGRFRYHIMLKGPKTPEIIAVLSKIEHEELSCSITVDPYYML